MAKSRSSLSSHAILSDLVTLKVKEPGGKWKSKNAVFPIATIRRILRNSRKSSNRKSRYKTRKSYKRSRKSYRSKSRKSYRRRRSRGMNFSTAYRKYTKKYMNRPSPPYSAMDYPGKIKMGNDKKGWISTENSNGYYTWKRL